MTTRKHGTINLLRQQLVDKHVHVAGFQETRDKESKLWPGTPFFRFCAAASPQGIGGIQLWISNVLPIARSQGRAVVFQKQHFTVGHASPRLLIVHGHTAGIHVAFIVGHAPHSGDMEASQWWELLEQELSRIPVKAQKIMMIDANARMNHFSDVACGDFGADPSDHHADCSDRLHQLLLEHRLCLPSTFSDFHTGEHATWSIGGRPGTRLDYVAIPSHWTQGEVRSQVDHDIRSGVSSQDHKAVTLRCRTTLIGHCEHRHHRRPIDRTAMHTEEGKEICRQIFQTVPQLPASTDPTVHCHVIEQHITEALETHFSLNRRQKKKPFLSDTTYAAVLKHRDDKRQLRSCYTWRKNTLLMRVFQHWNRLCGRSTDP
eukprot:Skav218159  [mRNA]  locus=scaffold4591:106495:107616:+ [translate_table: standard]